MKLKNPNCDESIKREELNLKKILGPQKEIIIPEMKKFEIQTSFGASEFGSHINLFTKEKNTPPQISTNFM